MSAVRLGRSVLSAALLVLVMALPAAAVKPVGDCPNEGFAEMTLPQFTALEISVGAPQELLDALPTAWATLDKNDDAQICIKDAPDTHGHFGAVLFGAVDNTSHSN